MTGAPSCRGAAGRPVARAIASAASEATGTATGMASAISTAAARTACSSPLSQMRAAGCSAVTERRMPFATVTVTG